jgi:hypothetical protein
MAYPILEKRLTYKYHYYFRKDGFFLLGNKDDTNSHHYTLVLIHIHTLN